MAKGKLRVGNKRENTGISCRKVSGWAAEEGTSEIREKTECWENKAKQICKHSSAWLQQQQHTALLPRAGRAWWTELWTRTHNHWIHFPAQLVTFPFLNICASASPPAEMDMETLILFVEFTNVILKRRLYYFLQGEKLVTWEGILQEIIFCSAKPLPAKSRWSASLVFSTFPPHWSKGRKL